MWGQEKIWSLLHGFYDTIVLITYVHGIIMCLLDLALWQAKDKDWINVTISGGKTDNLRAFCISRNTNECTVLLLWYNAVTPDILYK